MNKTLRRKEGTDGSIKSIASLLRNEKTEVAVSPMKEVGQEPAEIAPTPIVQSPSEEGDFFSKIVEIAKSKNYTCNQNIYIDADVKEVFRLMKVNGKVPISALISYILEEWITSHSDEITPLLQAKRNRLIGGTQ